MPEIKHLSNAPITQAIIDIRTKLPPSVDLPRLGSVHDLIRQHYPKRKERKRWEGRIELKEGEPPAQTAVYKGSDGYLYTSEDDKQTVQFRLDGFTFNRLKPYETWERMRDEARRLWRLYLQIATPEKITRIALRYINRLDIPLPITDFGDYLAAPPSVASGLPQGIRSFLTRVAIQEPASEATCIINQALESLTKQGYASLVLDIDVFKQSQLDASDEEAWRVLETMRNFKNRVFLRVLLKTQ